MRVWTLACAVLVAAIALVLWRVRAAERADVPRAPLPVAHVAARGGAPPTAAEQPADFEPEARTAAVDPPFEFEAGPAVRLELEFESNSTRLSLRVLDLDGKPWAQGRLLLEYGSGGGPGSRDTAPWTEAEFRSRIRLDSDGRSLSANLGQVRLLQGGLEWRTDVEGRAELAGIAPGLEFEVRALDIAAGVGGRYRAQPFEPGEVREATLRLERRAWPLQGRCLDPLGAPLSAHVALTSGATALEATADAEGRFAFPPLFADEVTLTGKKRGVVQQVLQVALPSAPLELRFEAARALTVTLVDPAGKPFMLHEMRAHGPPGDTRIDTFPQVEDGVHLFESMPWVPLTLTIEGCGGHPTLAVEAEETSVRWTLPRPGQADFEWAATTPELGGRIVFDLVRLDGSRVETVESRDVYRGQPIPSWRLFPGRYRLQILTGERDFRSEVHPVGGAREFEVRTGEATFVTVGD
jgi:hypothetical protein